MPEIKHTFTSGKMNKDLDERLVPNGEYRDAMNVEVSSSESSDVGTVQNILGNTPIEIENFDIGVSVTLGSIADEKIDTLYYLVWSPAADYIISYKRGDNSPVPVLVDKNKNVLKFASTIKITGINVIDDMLFFTDTINEPKKINIPRCQKGTPNWTSHTKLINDSQDIDIADAIDIEEKHITMIKPAPKYPLSMDLRSSRPPIDINGNRLIYTGVITISVDSIIPNSFVDPDVYNFSNYGLEEDNNTFDINIEDGVFNGVEIPIGDVGDEDGLTGWHKPQPSYGGSNPDLWKENINPGTKIVFKPFDDNGTLPGIPVTDFAMKGVIEDIYPDSSTGPDARTTGRRRVRVRLTTIDGYPPVVPDGFDSWKYVVDLFDKYEDGEYSPFAPFTQVAFIPGAFDYHPRKGYNLGMTNTLRKVVLKNVVTDETPKDIVSVDVLFKDEVSPNIYIVETIRADDNATSGGQNLWDKLHNYIDGSGYEITTETINSVVPSNQLLRSWDNIPKKALAQDVTGNRIVYANYFQNYDLIAKESGKKYHPGDFDISWVDFTPTELETSTNTARSIKSLREYQVGVVFTDKYGRETPVISNASSSIRLEKERADRKNRIKVSLNSSGNRPQDLSHFKFFVKETAGEYYNLALDRWYDAEDGNIWLAFASSDRNKIDIDSFLILKKGAYVDNLVKERARYKVIDIKNEAPKFIRTSKKLAAELYHTEGDSSKDLFGSGVNTAPLVGRDDFKLFYDFC